MIRNLSSRLSAVLATLRRLSLARIPQRNVIIYDEFSSRHLLPLLDQAQTTIFDLDFPRINVRVLIGCLRYGRPSSLTYLLSFVRLTNPRVVVTTSDNSINFYAIKSHFPSICTVAIQNGRRNTFGPRPHSSFQLHLHAAAFKPHCDYYFTFGTTEQRQFEGLIDTTFVSHGHFKNNFFAHIEAKRVNPARLSFISSFPNLNHSPKESVESDIPVHFYESSAILSRDYFSPEKTVSKFLHDYCLQNGLEFQVIAKQGDGYQHEVEYYKECCENPRLRVVECNPEAASYQNLIDSDFVIAIDSTLGYEMLGRGVRTGFFAIRAASIAIEYVRCPNFGFPEVVDMTGQFWTNYDNDDEFRRVLSFIINCSNDEWVQAIAPFLPKVMNLDPDNAQLMAVLASHGVTHNGGIKEVRRRAMETYGIA